MSNIKVAVRVRPLNKKEKDEGSKAILQVKGDTVSIENVKLYGISEIADSRERIKHFMFDHCYDCMAQDKAGTTASQAAVFQDLGTDVLQAAFSGFNACVFAYGQTGTGKTYTMMGQEGDVGLIPRICESLFSHVAFCADDNVTCRIDISYYEIYNERVRDLLQPELLKQNEKYSLKVREHPKEGPYVKDLSWHRVKDNDEIQALIDTGNDYRVTAETYMHDHSSRSHAIVTICFTQARLEENRPSEIVSKIHLVDLAGSERADPSSKPGFRKRLTEGANINRSLVTLGYVIKALAEKSLLSWSTEDMGSIQNFQSSGGGESMASNSPSSPNKQRLPYIPYRDSVLTWLLKDSLGGNSKTIMIATITPASQYYSETISTLRYAQRAKNIINKPRINEDSNVALIRELRKEIERLHSMLAEAQSSGNLLTLPDSEDSKIAERLHENEEMAKQLTQSWMCKWSSTHDIMKETDLSIRGLHNRSNSMGVMIDSQLPYLVAMDDDILSTGVCIFHLKEGETLIGTEDADREQDIVLMGPHIQKEHCFIENLEGVVTMVPSLGAMCAVQGIEVTEPTRLSQGDFLVLGGNQVFRFNNPTEAAKLREHRKSQGSLNLSGSRLSFGGLSRASSFSSIMSEDPSYLSPHSQYLRSSYPNYADADLCLDLERRYKTENERIEAAGKELQKLREDHERSEELRQEEEERMYQLHDQHRQEIEEQRHHLAKLIEENQRARQKAEEELELARESLAKEKEAFQKQLNEERGRLKELRKQESSAVQTDPQQTSSIATDPLLDVFSQGTQGELLKPTYSCERKLSAEEQLQELEQMEFERKLSYRETEQSLSIQQEDLEDQYNDTQDQIEAKIKQIRQIEEQYKELDKTHLQEISAQKKKIESLRKKETELEVYIEEKEELMKVKTDLPRPLRNATSEMFLLNPELQNVRIPQKTTSLSDIQAGIEAAALCEQRTPLSASSESLKSPVTPHSNEITAAQAMETSKTEGENIKRKHEPEDKHAKISSIARDVTSRLYQPPEPKFKYVPKSKEKETKNVPMRVRVPRERESNAIGRGSPSRFLKDAGTRQSPSPLRDSDQKRKGNPSKLVRNTDKRHSPSPLRHSPSPVKQSPSPSRDTVRQSSPSLSRGRGKQHGNSATADKNRKPVLTKHPDCKKVGATKSTYEIVGSRALKKESPIMAVRNKTPVDNASALIDLKIRRSPDRLGVASNRFGGTSPLRQMASASSLASVPESLNEEDNGSVGMPDHSEPVIKKRNKRGRALLDDDEFRRHSAPDYDKLENEFNAYTKEMMGFHPGVKHNVSVSPTYKTSISVDESKFLNSQQQEDERAMTDDTAKTISSKNRSTEGHISEEQTFKFYVSSGDELTSEETETNEESKTKNLSGSFTEFLSEDSKSKSDQITVDKSLDMETSAVDIVNTESDTGLKGVKRDHVETLESDFSLSRGKKSKSDKVGNEVIVSPVTEPKGQQDDSFSNDSLDEEEMNNGVVLSNRLSQSLPYNIFSKKINETLSDDSLEDLEEAKHMLCTKTETEVLELDERTVTGLNIGCENIGMAEIAILENEPVLQAEGNQADASECEETKFQCEEPEKFIATLDIKTNNDLTLSEGKDNVIKVKNDTMNGSQNKLEVQTETSGNEDGKFKAFEHRNIVSFNLARDMVGELKSNFINVESGAAVDIRTHEELEVYLALEGETKLTHEELELMLKLDGEFCVVDVEHKNNIPDQSKAIDNGTVIEPSESSEGINVPFAKDLSIDFDIPDIVKEEKEESEQNNEPVKSDIFTEVILNTETKTISVPDDLKQRAESLAITGVGQETEEFGNEKQGQAFEISKADILDQDGISATEILQHSRTIAVWTSQEYIADMDSDRETLSDQGFDDPHKELQVLQEALEQLPAKSSTKDGPQLSTARRAARQRAMIRKELRTTDSNGVNAQSDDSPASGNLSKSSSRPGSGSRRRRRPNGRGLAQTVSEHTTDEYASSDSDSLFSDDSLRNASDRSGDQDNLVQNPNVLNSTSERSRPTNLEIYEVESVDMLQQHYRGGSKRRLLRLDRQTNGVEVTSFNGGRSVGIQTSRRSDRIHSGGSTRTDTSDEFDISFTGGDYSSISRNMVMSPLSLWSNNERRDSDSGSDQNSSSSAGIKVRLNDFDRSLTPTPLSSARSSASVFSFKSNLDKGPTEVWSSSASDLRKLAGFREDLEYVIETEGMWPGQAPLDYSEDTKSHRSLKVQTPLEGERVTPSPTCSMPNTARTAAKVVHVTFPDGQSLESEAYSLNTPVKYQVTIHEDNTNILYNVDKTEYKTYSLRNQSDTQPTVIPETIHVNLTESVTSETHEKYESKAKEDISFHKPDYEQDSGDDSVILERSLRSSCSSEREVTVENGAFPREHLKELTERTEQQKFQVPLQKADSCKTKRQKQFDLHQSGIIATVTYSGIEGEAIGGDTVFQMQSDVNADESDTTSDYGTFTSIDGRKGLVCFTSDSEEGDTDGGPSISPRASHMSAQHFQGDIKSSAPKSLNQLPEQSDIFETLEENIVPLSLEGQNVCSVQEVVNQPVIAARVQSSSPTQLIQTCPSSLNHGEFHRNENHLEIPIQMSPAAASSTATIKSLAENQALENKSDTSYTLEVNFNENESKTSSRETLESIETIKYDSDENKTKSEYTECPVNRDSIAENLENIQNFGFQSPTLSPTPLKGQRSSISSTDEVYLSLEKLESSTSSSDYQTPQQSPEMIKETTSKLVNDVEIPDFDSDGSSLSPTPRGDVVLPAHSKEQEDRKPEKAMAVRTVSVNTEAVSLVSPSPAVTRQTFFDENDPAYADKIRKELEKKIATLKHKERSLSDSAISSDFTDGDSSPRGSRFYDSGKHFGGSHLRGRLQIVYNAAQSPNKEGVHANFDAPSVKKSLFSDSGNVYDHEDEEKISKDSDEKAKTVDGVSVGTPLDEHKTDPEPQVLSTDKMISGKCLLGSEKISRPHLVPIANAVEKFPEKITDAVLALKPYPYPHSVSLDGLSSLVNVDTHLSRAVRNIPSENPGLPTDRVSTSGQKTLEKNLTDVRSTKTTEEYFADSKKQLLHEDQSTQQVDQNQNFLCGNEGSAQIQPIAGRYSDGEGQHLSPGQLLIRPHTLVENRASFKYESRSKIKGKSPSLSDLESLPIKKVQRSLSEANIDDFEENVSPSSSSDSITFVFVDKNNVLTLEDGDICKQEDDDCNQEYRENYSYQNEYDPCGEYSENESQSPDSKLYSGSESQSPDVRLYSESESQSPDSKAYSGSESQSPDVRIYLGGESHSPDSRPYSVTESQSPDSRPISGLAPSGTESEDYLYDMNTGEKIVYRDGFPGGLQSEEVLERTNSRHSNSCEEILDDSSTHSASEEIEEIVNVSGERSKIGSSREISVRLENVSPPTYTDPSDEQTQSDGLDQNVINSWSFDDKPLRHKFGIDESVLPIPERAVSADNLPKYKIRFKDLQRSRSADMLEVGGSNEQESEEGIFPPMVNFDEDQTDPSISLRTMSEGGLDHVSQRTVSELGMTYSSRTSSELDSVSSASDSSVAKVKVVQSGASTLESSGSEEEYQEEIVIEYAKAYCTDKISYCESGMEHAALDNDHARKSPSSQSEGEVDPTVLQNDEHIRKVLRTVEKFIMPKQILVDHGTSTDDENCSRYVSVGVQTSAVDCGTQTAEINPIHVNPEQILLPALAAPFRAQSMDSFGLGVNMPQLVLSEGSDNWCTLSQLMVETTNLLRRINETLPGVESRSSLAPSKESQAILEKWQEISIQTGYSLADLTSVGLQTDDDIMGFSLVRQRENHLDTNESTQIDKQFKIKPLKISETVTSELVPGLMETCEMSIQTDQDFFEVPQHKVKVEKATLGSENDKVTRFNEQSDPSQNSTTEKTVLPQGKIETDDKINDLIVIGSNEASSSLIPTSHAMLQAPSSSRSESMESITGHVAVGPFVVETPAYRSRQMSTPFKQKVTMPSMSGKDAAANAASAYPTVLSANSSEIEALRKEHAKLIENLKNATTSRMERHVKIKTRKHVPEFISRQEELTHESRAMRTSPPDSPNAPRKDNKPHTVYRNEETIDRKEKIMHRPSSPREFVTVETDQRTGIKFENTTYISEKEGNHLEKKRKGILHEETWQLTDDGIMKVPEEKPDLTGNYSRTESSTSLSSDGTTESEIVTVVAGLDHMTDPVEYAAARAGALNPLFKNEEDLIDDVLGNDIIKAERREVVGVEPVIEKMIKTLKLKPEILYGDSAEMYEDTEKVKVSARSSDDVIESKQETVSKVFLPEEETIVPKSHKRNNVLPSQFPGGLENARKVFQVAETSTDHGEMNLTQKQDISKSETNPMYKTALQWSALDGSSEKLLVDTLEWRVSVSDSNELNINSRPVLATQPPVMSNGLSPEKKFAPTFGHSDDSTQVSMEFSDDFTQTDPDTSADTVVHMKTDGDEENIHNDESHLASSKANTLSNCPVRARPEVSNSLTRELERLQNERGEIMELLSLNYLPTSLTVELLEAKLNYCIGQTDLLLGSLDDNVKPAGRSRGTVVDQQFAKEYIAKYRADLKKSKQDIQMCRDRLQIGRMGSGRGRTQHRNRDLYHARRLAQIEAFRLERMREQQDYQRSRCSTPIKGNTPLRGNTPLKGNSPIATPRSNISRDSSPDYSPAYMTPREHKAHFSDLRKQLITNVLEEERHHTRSCSPTLLGHHPDNRQLDVSFGFSPQINVSASSGVDREEVREYSVPPGTYTGPRINSVDRYPHLSASYYQHPHHFQSCLRLDTKMMAESIFSPQESEQILREIRMIQQRSQMLVPTEEIPRTSSFSSTHSHRSAGSLRGGLPPQGHSNIPGQSHGSLSPVTRQTDTSLNLNLDSLHDSRHDEDTQPYSPYSAYAREHIIPSERSHDGGVLRGSYELYDSRSHERTHDQSHDRSNDGSRDVRMDSPNRSGLNEQRLSRLRPVSSSDVKAKLGRHKR